MERRRARRPPQRPLVLVVDADGDTRELYAMALRSFGFETDTASDVADAYLRAWTTHPDVIATEIWLPADDGWSFIRDLKRDARTRDIPIVVVTSQDYASVRERAEREACTAFLAKPCLPDDLATTLRGALNVQTHDRNPASR